MLRATSFILQSVDTVQAVNGLIRAKTGASTRDHSVPMFYSRGLDPIYLCWEFDLKIEAD